MDCFFASSRAFFSGSGQLNVSGLELVFIGRTVPSVPFVEILIGFVYNGE
jgi:hypothetical protein